MGVVPPAPGLQRLPRRDSAARHGALFVSDEVMTGFRVIAQGQWGLDGAVEGWRPDLMTFGKVMGGGFPAAAFGGRADVMAHLAPGGPGLPGRHAVGEPGRDHRRPRHAAAGHRRGLRPPRRAAADDHQGRRRRGAAAAPASPTWSSPRAPCSRCSSPTGRCADFADASAQDTARLRRVLPRHARPGRLPPAVARTRRGSSPPPTTTAPCRPCSTRCPRPPRQPLPIRKGPHDRARPSSTCCATARCTTPTASSTAVVRATTSPSWARRWPSGWPESIKDRDIVHLVASPLERAQETARPLAALRGLDVVTDDRVIESTNVFEGKAFGVGDGALRSPSAWRHLWNPFRPSWGEPYVEVAARMRAATQAARDAARGHEAVIVSHQLPIWVARLSAEGRPFLHDPRRRQCTLASLTSFHFEGGPADPRHLLRARGRPDPGSRQVGAVLGRRRPRGAPALA